MELPEDLRDIELQLAGRAEPGPDPALGARVLGAVRAELGRTVSRRSARRSFWNFAAGAAAALLLGANLSMSAAGVTEFGFRPERSTGALRAQAARIRGLIPGMDEREALRQAFLLRGIGRIVMVPAVGPQVRRARVQLDEEAF